MKLADQLTSCISAAFTGLWVTTSEADEAEREIVQHARIRKWKIAVWDVANGLRLPGANASSAEAGAGDPLAALRALPALADDKGTAIFVLHNFHRFLTSTEVVQTVFAQLVAGKQQRTFIIVLAPAAQIPVELEKLFVIIEHALPDHEQLERIARELTSDHPDDLPEGEDLQRVLDAAVRKLAETVGEWNEMIAAAVGQLKDGALGMSMEAPITQFANFEHLEAKGRDRLDK